MKHKPVLIAGGGGIALAAAIGVGYLVTSGGADYLTAEPAPTAPPAPAFRERDAFTEWNYVPRYFEATGVTGPVGKRISKRKR